MRKRHEHEVRFRDSRDIRSPEQAITPPEVRMHDAQRLTCTTVRTEKHSLEVRMAVDKPDEFATGITRGAKNRY